MKQIGTLHVHEDVTFTEREWCFERCGWVFLGVIIVAALLGAFGSGLLSEQRVRTADEAISVTHSRIVRRQTAEILEIQFHHSGQPHAVSLSETLAKAWRIEGITPEPESVIPGEGRTTYHFHGNGPARVTFVYQSEQVGPVQGTLEFSPEQTITLGQFSLP